MHLSASERALLRGLLEGQSLRQLAIRNEITPLELRRRLHIIMEHVSQRGARAAGRRWPEVDHELLSRLLGLWSARRGPRGLPAHGQFRLTDLQPWIGNIGIVEVEGSPPRAKVRLAGRKIIEYDDADFSGRYLEDVVPEHARPAILEPYRLCVEQRAPQYSLIVPRDPALSEYRLHRLLLPCSAEGRDVDVIVAGIFIDRWEAGEGETPASSVYDLLQRKAG